MAHKKQGEQLVEALVANTSLTRPLLQFVCREEHEMDAEDVDLCTCDFSKGQVCANESCSNWWLPLDSVRRSLSLSRR